MRTSGSSLADDQHREPNSVGVLDESLRVAKAEHAAAIAAANAKATAQILLIDESQMTRECLEYALRSRAPDLFIQARAHVDSPPVGCPDVVILDMKNAEVAGDQARLALQSLRRIYADARVILVSERGDSQSACAAIRAGFAGYVPTTLSIDMLIASVRLVLAGGVFVPTELISALAAASSQVQRSELEGSAIEGFTERELEVLRALREGKPNKIIAHDLDIAVSTVKVHIRNIMKKLNATNRTQVVLRTRSDETYSLLAPHALTS